MAAEGTTELDLAGIEPFITGTGHSLVLGGPGSGKTTAALVKASLEIKSDDWHPYQHVLFLSFARSTVARVAEAAVALVDKTARRQVELTTYHAFIWRLIRSHGYLLQNHPGLRILPPHDAAVKIADATKGLKGDVLQDRKRDERQRLLVEEGLLDFDLFAGFAADLLEKSKRLCEIISRRYPLIFLDEFQDTNASEYRFIRCLANCSRIICLADSEQRIYEFRGADPKRIEDFIADYSPEMYDFADRNHRSNGRDILQFANDLLKRTTGDCEYNDVKVSAYPQRKGETQHIFMKAQVLEALRRSKKRKERWSVVVLVPTKNLMLAVSDCLSKVQPINDTRKLPQVSHRVAVDTEGPALAGILIGRLLERNAGTSESGVVALIEDLCAHIFGRKGGRPPSQAEASLVGGIRAFRLDGKVTGVKRKRIVADCERIFQDVMATSFTGSPFADWVTVRDIIESSALPELKGVASDARYLRFLNKGASLRLALSRLWQQQASYHGALAAVQSAFIEEHFSAKSQEPRGVHVMTIHKSKGKEFDEVVIYEGTYRDRIVRSPSEENSVAQSRLSLRVAVSRARHRVTIVTPAAKICELLSP